MRLLRFCILSSFLVATAAADDARNFVYQIQELPFDRASFAGVEGVALTNLGDVAGNYIDYNGGKVGFVWSHGELDIVGVSLKAMNDKLEAIAFINAQPIPYSIIYRNGISTPLPQLSPGKVFVATNINNNSDVVGNSMNSADYWAALWDGAVYRQVSASSVRAVTYSRDTAGQCNNGKGFVACATHLGVFYEVPTPVPATDSVALGLNMKGDVIGTVQESKGPHAFLSRNGLSIWLAPAPSTANSVNEWGEVVGDGPGYGFVYRGAKVYNINYLIPQGYGYQLTRCHAVNDRRQILASGNKAGTPVLVILTPTYE